MLHQSHGAKRAAIRQWSWKKKTWVCCPVLPACKKGTEARMIEAGTQIALDASEMSRTQVIHVDDMANHPDAIYIGRAVSRRKLKATRWANPYHIGKDGDRAEVIAKYRKRVDKQMRTGPASTTHSLRKLAGKPLACWCRHDGEERTDDNVCHGDVLVELIEELGLEREWREPTRRL